jgi:hypothetical protein
MAAIDKAGELVYCAQRIITYDPGADAIDSSTWALKPRYRICGAVH